jgi:hypothetical protein
VNLLVGTDPDEANTLCSTPRGKLGSGKFQAFLAIHPDETETAAERSFSPANRSFDPKLIRNHNSMKFFPA